MHSRFRRKNIQAPKIITFKELFSEFFEVSKIKKVGIVGGFHNYPYDLFRIDEEPGQQDRGSRYYG